MTGREGGKHLDYLDVWTFASLLYLKWIWLFFWLMVLLHLLLHYLNHSSQIVKSCNSLLQCKWNSTSWYLTTINTLIWQYIHTKYAHLQLQSSLHSNNTLLIHSYLNLKCVSAADTQNFCLLTGQSWRCRRVWRWPSGTDSRIGPWCRHGLGWCWQSPEG